jgi:phosphate uptake regulator
MRGGYMADTVKLTKLINNMVDIVRQSVINYQTDLAYDVAKLALNSDDTYYWCVRESGTELTSDKKFLKVLFDIKEIKEMYVIKNYRLRKVKINKKSA